MAYYPPFLKFTPRRWSLEIDETGAEPVSLADLKEHCRIDDGVSDHDDALTAYGKAARAVVEQMTNRAIVEQTRILRMSCFPYDAEQFVELPGGRIQSVSSVAYTDENGQAATFTDYATDFGTRAGTGRIHLASDLVAWPTDEEIVGLPVVITYTAGYDLDGSPADVVPPAIVQAIKMIADDMFNERGTMAAPGAQRNPVLDALLAREKVWARR